jgi:hypothetical protein
VCNSLRNVLYALLCFLLSNQDLVERACPLSLSKLSIKNVVKENLDKVSVVTIKVVLSSLSYNWRPVVTIKVFFVKENFDKVFDETSIVKKVKEIFDQKL